MSNKSGFKEEYPPKADLRKLYRPLPFITPGTVKPDLGNDEIMKQVGSVLSNVNAALENGDAPALEQCFFSDQAHWRDILALTSHLRTFSTPAGIVGALLATKKLSGFSGGLRLQGEPKFVPATPVLVSYPRVPGFLLLLRWYLRSSPTYMTFSDISSLVAIYRYLGHFQDQSSCSNM